MNHAISLSLKITKVRVNWDVTPDHLSRQLGFEFVYDSEWDFSVYKGEKITEGLMWFREGTSKLFGELSYIEGYKLSGKVERDIPGGLNINFLCSSSLFNTLTDCRAEFVGANICLRLDEEQSTIRYANELSPDNHLIFDLAKKPHIAITDFSLSFAPYTKVIRG